MNHLSTLDAHVPLYRSVGKAFFATERGALDRRLEQDLDALTRSQRDLADRQEYLERRLTSSKSNLRDLTAEFAM